MKHGFATNLRRTVDHYIFVPDRKKPYITEKIPVLMIRISGKTTFAVDDPRHGLKMSADSIDEVLTYIDGVLAYQRATIIWESMLLIQIESTLTVDEKSLYSDDRPSPVLFTDAKIEVIPLEYGVDENGQTWQRPPNTQRVSKIRAKHEFGFRKCPVTKRTRWHDRDKLEFLIKDTPLIRQALQTFGQNFERLIYTIYELFDQHTPEQLEAKIESNTLKLLSE